MASASCAITRQRYVVQRICGYAIARYGLRAAHGAGRTVYAPAAFTALYRMARDEDDAEMAGDALRAATSIRLCRARIGVSSGAPHARVSKQG